MRIEVDTNGNITEHEDAPIVPPTEQEIKDRNNAPIFIEISKVEAKQARPLREAFSPDEVVREQAMKYLKQYNDEITALREQLL